MDKFPANFCHVISLSFMNHVHNLHGYFQLNSLRDTLTISEVIMNDKFVSAPQMKHISTFSYDFRKPKSFIRCWLSLIWRKSFCIDYLVSPKAIHDSEGTEPETAKRNNRNETSETSKTKQVKKQLTNISYQTFWCVVQLSIFVVCILHISHKYSANQNV